MQQIEIVKRRGFDLLHFIILLSCLVLYALIYVINWDISNSNFSNEFDNISLSAYQIYNFKFLGYENIIKENGYSIRPLKKFFALGVIIITILGVIVLRKTFKTKKSILFACFVISLMCAHTIILKEKNLNGFYSINKENIEKIEIKLIENYINTKTSQPYNLEFNKATYSSFMQFFAQYYYLKKDPAKVKFYLDKVDIGEYPKTISISWRGLIMCEYVKHNNHSCNGDLYQNFTTFVGVNPYKNNKFAAFYKFFLSVSIIVLVFLLAYILLLYFRLKRMTNFYIEFNIK